MAKKNKIFSSNSKFVSKYYSTRGRKLQEVRSEIADNFATSGARSQTRYKALMDTLTESERDRIRETYASDEVFEIGDIVQNNNLFIQEAEKIYNERVSKEVDDLLNQL